MSPLQCPLAEPRLPSIPPLRPISQLGSRSCRSGGAPSPGNLLPAPSKKTSLLYSGGVTPPGTLAPFGPAVSWYPTPEAAFLCFALLCFALQCVAFSPREFPSVARPGPVALAPAQTRLWPAGPLRAGWVEPGAPGWDWGWKRVAPGESVLMTPKLSLLAILVPPLVGKGTWGHRGGGKRRPSPGGCAGLAGARSAGVGSAWICGRTGRRSGQGRTG